MGTLAGAEPSSCYSDLLSVRAWVQVEFWVRTSEGGVSPGSEAESDEQKSSGRASSGGNQNPAGFFTLEQHRKL